MSRWIDVEWLMNFFVDIPNNFTLTIGNLRATVNDAPSIDIVRCGECKHWDDRRNDAWWSKEGACSLTSRLGDATYRNHDDFCSYGERKL